ncbi:polycomb protein Asx isoform X2 [Cylas formicarius]|uniref:polycomb protein Asx isoform X2 n=1 Tax=Cylas formicarius TaxID=197179 RepID=UPI002958509E|nr:polycomb protein Asx isoform X2 [Cylas formicarius]
MEIDDPVDINPDKIPAVLCQVEDVVQSVCVSTSTKINFKNENDLEHKIGRKTIKHALRRQAKCRKKNSKIGSCSTLSIPRIIVKPIPPQTDESLLSKKSRIPTMREVLASIPGFNMKPRKRTNKKLSTAAQLEQTKEGCIDLETPDSILVNTNLRLLLNKGTFASLPLLYQNKLVQLLPSVDRQIVSNSSDPNCIEISSVLNNEFFARACLEWQDRLAEGEFTPENQQKLKLEADKERSKLDPWKLKHFEPIWGFKSASSDCENFSGSTSEDSIRPPIKTTIKLRPSTTTLSNRNKPLPPPPVKRLRTVGAITRSCSNLKEEMFRPPDIKSHIPDLLPIKQMNKIQVKLDDIKPEVVSSDMLDNLSNQEHKELSEKESSNIEIPENCIVNISDSILETNEETIIICRDHITNGPQEDGLSHSNYDKSLKCKSISPLALSPEPMDTSELKDPLEINTESLSDDEKVSEHTSESTEQLDDYEKDKMMDENSSSSCSVNVQNLEEISSNETIETVDSLQLQENYKEINHVDESSSSSATTTTSTNTDAKSVCSQDESMISTPDITDIIPVDTEINVNAQEMLISSSEEKPMYIESPVDSECHLETTDSSEKLDVLQQPFQMLPNTLILQQESLILADSDIDAVNKDDSVDKLEASVEEADLVINFNGSKIIHDDDANEDRFIDAENYVLESGQISVSSIDNDQKKVESDIQATFFGDNVSGPSEECCWGLVDSSTEKLLSPLNNLESSVSAPIDIPNQPSTSEHVQVIPMQEELEVRLEEGTFPVPNDWPYDVKMDSDMVEAALGPTENSEVKGPPKGTLMQEYNTASQVKLELEVTLTPEIISSDSLITSTVNTSNISTNQSVLPSSSRTVTTVIPPTTIVCLPSVVNMPPQHPSVNEASQCAPAIPRPGSIQSSSALPYLALSTSQPIRAVPTHSKTKPKHNTLGNRNRGSNKPPPGAVNLERSYQICQAVIQNSPNRHQLRCQLKPPPSLLAAAANNNKRNENRQTQYSSVTSSRGSSKTFTPPLPAIGNYQISNNMKKSGQKFRPGLPCQHQRQPSPPVVVRHVFTSGQGIPVTMAVLPHTPALSPELAEGQANNVGQVGQYILVHRTGINDHSNIPRSSSAPPSQQQMSETINTGTTSQMISVGSRGRPASVEAEHPADPQSQVHDFIVQCPNPGVQAVTRRQRLGPGIIYGDISVDSPVNNYTIIGDNVIVDHPVAAMQNSMIVQQQQQQQKRDSCACSLKAMIVCKKCGSFCHDDCIGPNKLCRTCFIR